MANSKISICNLALASLGADAIRDFDENNKRARMCDVFYDHVRDWLLTKFDWPFARKLEYLQSVDIDSLPVGTFVPEGTYVYAIPNACKTVRDLYPPGSRNPWEVLGKHLYCKVPPTEDTIQIFYTAQITDVSLFSETFASLLASGIAVRIGPAITQDKALVGRIVQQFEQEQRDAWESDANEGNSYRAYDEDPQNDTFVNPDGYEVDDDDFFRRR